MNRPSSQPTAPPALLPLLPALSLLPVVALLAVGSWAAGQADPTAAAEGWYLALVAAWGVACAAALVLGTPRQGTAVLGLAASMMLLVTAVWVVPGSTGGPVVMALLLFTVAGAAYAGLRRLEEGEPLPLPAALALALAAQVFFRGDRFLLHGTGAPGVGELATLFVLPGVAALALWSLSRRYGATAALAAGGVMVVATPGWTALSALVLLALAAGSPGGARRATLSLLPVVLVLLPAAVLGGREEAVVAALLVLLLVRLERLPGLWALPAQGALLLLSGLLLWRWGVPASWEGMAFGLVFLLLLMPAVLVLPFYGAGWRRLVPAAVVAVLGLTFLPGTAGVGPAAALVALAEAPRHPRWGRRLEGWFRSVHRLWVPLLVGYFALPLAYPWFRPNVAEVEYFAYGWGLPMLSLGLAVVGLGLTARVAKPIRESTIFVGAAAALLLPLVFLPRGEPWLPEPVRLTAEAPEWRVPVPASTTIGSLREIVVDSNLSNSVDLSPGTVVGWIWLTVDGEAQPLALRVGKETGEWAAGRRDLEVEAPSPWRVWVAPGGEFFGRRYRYSQALSREPKIEAVKIERSPSLPEAVVWNLFQVAGRREDSP